jgi:hypothetical protein
MSTTPLSALGHSAYRRYDALCRLLAARGEVDLRALGVAALLAAELDRADPSPALVAELCERLGLAPEDVPDVRVRTSAAEAL